MTEITTTDYHAGGEPFRVVTGGVPALEGRTVRERRRWVAANLDHVRQLLVNEPRGHADMYGGFVTPPDDPEGDLGVRFFHNEGYSTACGHGTIALVTWAIDSGRVAIEPGALGLRRSRGRGGSSRRRPHDRYHRGRRGRVQDRVSYVHPGRARPDRAGLPAALTGYPPRIPPSPTQEDVS